MGGSAPFGAGRVVRLPLRLGQVGSHRLESTRPEQAPRSRPIGSPRRNAAKLHVSSLTPLSADPSHLRRDASLVLAFYLNPPLWLERRRDVTTLVDVNRISWVTTLQVRIDTPGLLESGISGLSAEEAAEGLLLPVLLKRRELATGLTIRNHAGEDVPGVPWSQTRPMIESILVAMATRIVRATGSQGLLLDPAVELALRRFGGDVDEVRLGARDIISWAREQRQTGLHHIQASALLRDPAMNFFLFEHIQGFLVIVRAGLRPNLSCELFIEHDASLPGEIEDKRIFRQLLLPVSASPSYQFELRLPHGARFDTERPNLMSVFPGEAAKPISQGNTPSGRLVEPPAERPKDHIEPWFEVWDRGMAGFAAVEPRGTEWRLRLRQRAKGLARFTHGFGLRQWLRNEPKGLVSAVRGIALAAAAVFVGALLARGLGFHADTGALQPLLALWPSVLAAFVLQRSDVPLRELIAAAPRRWLLAIAATTFVGAATLAVRFPSQIAGHTVPLLDRFGWGWRAGLWVILTAMSVLLAAAVTWLARRAW